MIQQQQLRTNSLNPRSRLRTSTPLTPNTMVCEAVKGDICTLKLCSIFNEKPHNFAVFITINLQRSVHSVTDPPGVHTIAPVELSWPLPCHRPNHQQQHHAAPDPSTPPQTLPCSALGSVSAPRVGPCCVGALARCAQRSGVPASRSRAVPVSGA